MKPANERRTQLDLRRTIDEFVARGWTVTGRNPVTFERGRMRRKVQHGCVVEGLSVDNEKSRAEFEAWCKRTQGGTGRRNEDGEYISEDWEYSWWAWQASRAELVVELPETCSPGDFAVDAGVFTLEVVLSALTAAGITVKEGV